jgi:uncharacterized membrane protein
MVVVFAVVVIGSVVTKADAIDDDEGDDKQQILFVLDVFVVPVVFVELSTTFMNC